MTKFNEKKEILSGTVLVLLIIIVLLGVCFSGCSPQWHVKKAIKKDPTILVHDTITVIDTFTVHSERVDVDSIFMVSKDTVTIIKDNLTIKHFIRNDSVFITGECDTVFLDVIREIEVPFEKIVINDTLPRWVYLVIGSLVLLEILTVGLFLRITKRY